VVEISAKPTKTRFLRKFMGGGVAVLHINMKKPWLAYGGLITIGEINMQIKYT
jgi:hypothetical protein